jgi:hypothetical protein
VLTWIRASTDEIGEPGPLLTDLGAEFSWLDSKFEGHEAVVVSMCDSRDAKVISPFPMEYKSRCPKRPSTPANARRSFDMKAVRAHFTAFVGFLTALTLLVSTFSVAASAAPVPECFTAPPQASDVVSSRPSVSLPASPEPTACVVLRKLLASTSHRDIAWIPGDGVNEILGLSEGGFPAGSYVVQFRVSKAFNAAFVGRDELVRFASGEGAARGGSWWTLLECVTDSNGRLDDSRQISSILALPPQSEPHVIAFSSGVAEGTMGYFGVISPAFGRDGGGMQFWFPSEPVFTSKTAALPLK